MTKDKYPLYGLAIVAAGALAIWAGMPPLYLLLLACPVMMFFMMGGMSGRSGHDENGSSHVDDKTPPHATKPGRLDGSHDRIDQP